MFYVTLYSVSLEFFADIIIPASRLKRKDQMELYVTIIV